MLLVEIHFAHSISTKVYIILSKERERENIYNQLIVSLFLAQARLDGIFCDYDENEKLEFLKRCSEQNVVNIEMESLCFSGFLNYANCKCKLFMCSLGQFNCFFC